jgi:hypothetical protein
MIFVATIVSVLTAVESNRFYNQQRIIKIVGANRVDSEIRYSWLEKSPISNWMNKQFGAYWNRDITSIHLYQCPSHEMSPKDSADLISRIAKLKRLRVINAYSSSLTKKQVKSFAELRTLQWVMLVHCNVDEEEVDYLRSSLPNTYVTLIQKDDST